MRIMAWGSFVGVIGWFGVSCEAVLFDEPNLTGEPLAACNPAYTPLGFCVKPFTSRIAIKGILGQMVPF
jgi:hypothetical protein